MNHLQQAAGRHNRAVLERKFRLPFGYQATFHWRPDKLRTHWYRTCQSFGGRVHGVSSLRHTRSRAAPFLKRLPPSSAAAS